MSRIRLAALLLTLAWAAAGDAAETTAVTAPVRWVDDSTALGGALGSDAVAAVTQAGIRTVIDLRTPEEGTAAEAAALASADIRYVNFPTVSVAPSRQRLQEFVTLLDALDGARLLHCASGNRAGMMWGLYRLEKGVPLVEVLQEVAGVVTKEPLLEIIRQHAADVAPTSLAPGP